MLYCTVQLVGGGACGLPVTDGGIQPWRQSSKLRRDKICRVSRREETVVQGDNSHGSNTGLGCRQRNTNTGWRILQRAQVTRAGRLITKEGTTAKASERDLLVLLSCGFAMAQVSGSGRRNLEHFTAWRVCRQVIRRRSTTAAEQGIPV